MFNYVFIHKKLFVHFISPWNIKPPIIYSSLIYHDLCLLFWIQLYIHCYLLFIEAYFFFCSIKKYYCIRSEPISSVVIYRKNYNIISKIYLIGIDNQKVLCYMNGVIIVIITLIANKYHFLAKA